jgi:hypothetical protein
MSLWKDGILEQNNLALNQDIKYCGKKQNKILKIPCNKTQNKT